jgi:hypothetical protein
VNGEKKGILKKKLLFFLNFKNIFIYLKKKQGIHPSTLHPLLVYSILGEG